MKIISLVAAFIMATLTFPLNGQSQTFISKLQRDVTPSGIDELSSHDATITFLKENMQVTIEFKDLNTDRYNLTYVSTKSNEKLKITIYSIDDNPFFNSLLLFEYKSVHNIKSASTTYNYTYDFVFLKMNTDGSTNHSTSFFCNTSQ